MELNVSSAIVGVVGILAACTGTQAHVTTPPDPQSRAAVVAPDALLTPIAPDYAARWLGAEEPLRIHGNTYLVGFSGMDVGLIRTSDGLILIDGALPQAVPAIIENLARLGFRIEDVKFILSTEPHFDHAGGLAALARASGATVVASPQAAEVLRRGRSGGDDPQAASLLPFPAVANVRTIADNETLTVGDVTVTAHATPGHTPGSMSWGWRSCEADDCRAVVFGSSLNPVAADGYRFGDPANRALSDGFRRTFALLRTLPCDILISAHPDQAGVDEHLRAFRRSPVPNPFIDPASCRTYAAKYERLFEARLDRERAGTADD